ncbi:MAG: Ppx/GppA family phosphatase [Chlorobiales bacterium]|nr:Ppx/GppA family phosphatase [Chlorobiales bacterium]
MRLAAIDMGTNSFHMVIVELMPDMSFMVVDREKDMIRIGAQSISTKHLMPEAIAQGLQSIVKFRKLAEQRGVDPEHIIAFGTSAIRESNNGDAFMKMIEIEAEVKTKIISGQEEARLIYLGVRNAINIGRKKVLIFDIGGGSVEFITGDGRHPEMMESKKLGVARMSERFVTTDPISQREQHLLRQFYEAELMPVVSQAKKHGYQMAIASSGTIENIARMIFQDVQNRQGAQKRGGAQNLDSINGSSFTRKEFQKLYNRALPMSSAERRELEGIDPKRADIIIPGLILVDVIMEKFGLEKIVVSESALREGMICDYLSNHHKEFRETHNYPDIRRRSVIELAYRFQWDRIHAEHVAKLALRLFDQLQPIHQLGEHERELSEYAAFLHNIGCFISMTGHHKHSYYIIINGGLRGFAPEEISVIANIVRYHRKSPPSLSHDNYAVLSQTQQYSVRMLAQILRLANALDRGHRQNVYDVEMKIFPKKIDLKLKAKSDPEIEMWGIERECKVFEDEYKRKLELSSEFETHELLIGEGVLGKN